MNATNPGLEMAPTSKRIGILLTLSGILIPVAAIAQTNLIYNGGFDGGFYAWQGGWARLGAKNLGNPPLTPGPLDGNYLGVVIDSQEAMRQSFPTTPGGTYRIEFGMRLPDLVLGHPYIGNSVVGPAQLKLEIDHQLLAYQLIENRTVWLMVSYEFTASRPRSELELSSPRTFEWNGQLRESESLFIDRVSVVAVPEPSGMPLMLLSGLCVMGARAMSRRNV